MATDINYELRYADDDPDHEFPLACMSCDQEVPTMVTKKSGSFTDDHDWLFCVFCASTYAGNAAQYPDVYDDNGPLMRHICAVANVLLEQLRDK